MLDESKTYRTDDVFGVARDIPINYVERDSVDGQLVASLTRGKHIVIFGSSKQGKTCLRKNALPTGDYIVVQCSNGWDLANLHSAILKQAGFQVTLSVKRATSGKLQIIASFGNTSNEVGGELSHSVEVEKRELELDPTDVNDITRALRESKFDKYIVLEDFHYLPAQTQIDFSVALKAFHETSKICFIIVGVWLEENRLIIYNGDLSGRIVSVNADRWSNDELKEVIYRGSKYLNIRFSDGFQETLLKTCQGSVWLVQDVCRIACEQKNIRETEKFLRVLDDDIDVKGIIANIMTGLDARYMSFLTNFADGFQETVLQMYRWLLWPVLEATSDELKKGLSYTDIRLSIQSKHKLGSGLSAGNLVQALASSASLQVKKGIKPIVLDYDQTTRRLNVVDKAFIIWMQHRHKQEMLEAAGLDDALAQQ